MKDAGAALPIPDASVVSAFFISAESGHGPSNDWLRTTTQAGIIISAPAILLTEVAAAVGKASGTLAEVQRAINNILALIRIHSVDEALATRAGEIAATHGIRGCDAIYIALAESLGDELVTLDDQQLIRGAAVVRTRKP